MSSTSRHAIGFGGGAATLDAEGAEEAAALALDSEPPEPMEVSSLASPLLCSKNLGMCNRQPLGQACFEHPSWSAKQRAVPLSWAQDAQACRFWKTVCAFRTRLKLKSSHRGGAPSHARGRSQRSLTAASTIFLTASASKALLRRSTSSRNLACAPIPTCRTKRTNSVAHLSPPSLLNSHSPKRMAVTKFEDLARCTANSRQRITGSNFALGAPAPRDGATKAIKGCPVNSISRIGIILSRELKPFNRMSTVTAFRKRCVPRSRPSRPPSKSSAGIKNSAQRPRAAASTPDSRASSNKTSTSRAISRRPPQACMTESCNSSASLSISPLE
mmetsp:Transcript_98897/g.317081  ORF Transcript_98897/g.317081 Transcript_98897/m.317081 type:complete len:330 (-) Transcript_98897:165-1154(-)